MVVEIGAQSAPPNPSTTTGIPNAAPWSPTVRPQPTASPNSQSLLEYSIRNNEGVTFVDRSQSGPQFVVSSTVGIFLT